MEFGFKSSEYRKCYYSTGHVSFPVNSVCSLHRIRHITTYHVRDCLWHW